MSGLDSFRLDDRELALAFRRGEDIGVVPV
jgi:hypothetical protein